MRCRKARKNLVAFLDGELQEDLREKVERHLERCTACRQEMMALRRLGNALDQMEAPAPPAWMTGEGILERARRETGDRRRARADRVRPVPVFAPPVWARGLLAGALVLLVVLVWWKTPLFRGRPESPAPTPVEIRVAEGMDLFENLDLIRDLSILEDLAEAEDRQAGRLG